MEKVFNLVDLVKAFDVIDKYFKGRTQIHKDLTGACAKCGYSFIFIYKKNMILAGHLAIINAIIHCHSIAKSKVNFKIINLNYSSQ